jgi:hypothetical protein
MFCWAESMETLPVHILIYRNGTGKVSIESAQQNISIN